MPRRPFGSVFRRRSRDGSLLPRYYVRWSDAEGRAHARAAGLTLSSAEVLLDALLGEKRLARGPRARSDAGRLQEGSALPLAAHAPEILHVWKSTLARGTLRDRRGSLGRWVRRLGRRPVSTLTPADVEASIRAMREEGLAASTIRTEVGILSSAFQTLRKALRVPLPQNPCRGVLLPSVHAHPRPHLPPDAIDRLIAACPEEYRGPLVVLADTGLRPAELFRLTWAEVDLHLGAGSPPRGPEAPPQDPGSPPQGPGGVLRLALTKTYQTRTIPLTARAREVLARAERAARDRAGSPAPPAPGDGPSTTGRPSPEVERVFSLSEKGFRQAFREAVQAAGLPQKLVLYSLRHAYASALLLEHAPPSVVRDLLGHANIKTTDIYLRSLPGDAARAAVDALERARGAPGMRCGPEAPDAERASGADGATLPGGGPREGFRA